MHDRRPSATATTPGLHSDDSVLELPGSDGMGGSGADNATDCFCDDEDDDDVVVQDNVVQGSFKKRCCIVLE